MRFSGQHLNRCVWGVRTIEPSFSYASIDLHVYNSCAMNAMTAIERPCSGKHTVPRPRLKFTALLWAAFSKHSSACKGYENLQQCWFRLFSVLFLPTNCVHRQYRPIDVRVPKGDPFLVGDWCFIKGQSCKKNFKKTKKAIHRFIMNYIDCVKWYGGIRSGPCRAPYVHLPNPPAIFKTQTGK